MPYVYILRCSDCSYYVGSTSNLEQRFAQHQEGVVRGYTCSRRPVELVWSEAFASDNEAFLTERQIKGWTRAKKEALIRGDFDRLHEIVREERKSREHQEKKSGAS